MAVLWAAGTVAFSHYRPVPLKADEAPEWNGPLYALDLLLPVINLGQDGYWRLEGVWQWAAAVLVLLGWILATTVAAGATRLLSRGEGAGRDSSRRDAGAGAARKRTGRGQDAGPGAGRTWGRARQACGSCHGGVRELSRPAGTAAAAGVTGTIRHAMSLFRALVGAARSARHARGSPPGSCRTTTCCSTLRTSGSPRPGRRRPRRPRARGEAARHRPGRRRVGGPRPVRHPARHLRPAQGRLAAPVALRLARGLGRPPRHDAARRPQGVGVAGAGRAPARHRAAGPGVAETAPHDPVPWRLALDHARGAQAGPAVFESLWEQAVRRSPRHYGCHVAALKYLSAQGTARAAPPSTSPSGRPTTPPRTRSCGRCRSTPPTRRCGCRRGRTGPRRRPCSTGRRTGPSPVGGVPGGRPVAGGGPQPARARADGAGAVDGGAGGVRPDRPLRDLVPLGVRAGRRAGGPSPGSRPRPGEEDPSSGS